MAFALSQLASEYRDAKLLLQKLEDGNGSIRPWNVRQADKARARLAAIRRSLEPPPHSKYGTYRRHRSDQPVAQDQFLQDLGRLFELKRRSKIGLTQEEVAEEAHRMARVDTLIYGAAIRRLANLERQVRLAPGNRPRLQPRATKDLRLRGCFMGCLRPSRRIRNRRPIIRSAMRSPPMTATSIRTTQNYGRLPSGLMKTASRSPTNPRSSTAIPTIGPIPRKGHRRLCRHNRRPIRHPGRTLLANETFAIVCEVRRTGFRSSFPACLRYPELELFRDASRVPSQMVRNEALTGSCVRGRWLPHQSLKQH